MDGLKCIEEVEGCVFCTEQDEEEEDEDEEEEDEEQEGSKGGV